MNYDLNKANKYFVYKGIIENGGVTPRDMLEAISSGNFHAHLKRVREKKAKRIAAATRLCRIIEKGEKWNRQFYR